VYQIFDKTKILATLTPYIPRDKAQFGVKFWLTP